MAGRRARVASLGVSGSAGGPTRFETFASVKPRASRLHLGELRLRREGGVVEAGEIAGQAAREPGL